LPRLPPRMDVENVRAERFNVGPNCGLDIGQSRLVAVAFADNDALHPEGIGAVAVRMFFMRPFLLHCFLNYVASPGGFEPPLPP